MDNHFDFTQKGKNSSDVLQSKSSLCVHFPFLHRLTRLKSFFHSKSVLRKLKMATTRIKKELRDLAKSPVEGLVVEPSAADMFIWDITIEGPTNTPYEVFLLKIVCCVSKNYFAVFHICLGW